MEKFCLKWNDFQVNVSKSFSTLRKEQDFHDVTLVSDDNKVISGHKVVLSASSEFFKNILRKADHAKPMIYLNGVGSKQLSQILDYIYDGEVQLFQEEVDNFLSIAHKLKIDGLIEEDTGTETKLKPDVHFEDVEDIVEKFTPKADKREGKVWNEGNNEKTVVLDNSPSLEDTKKVVDQMIVKDGDSWLCKTCNKTTRTNCQIRKHAEIHIDGLSFPCLICGKTFRSRQSFSQHKFSQHKQKQTSS